MFDFLFTTYSIDLLPALAIGISGLIIGFMLGATWNRSTRKVSFK